MTTQTTASTSTNGGTEAAIAAEARNARQHAQEALEAARESVGHGIEAARGKATAIGTDIKGKAAAIGTDIKGKAVAARRRAEQVKEVAVERYQGARKSAIKLANDGETWVKDHPTRSVCGALAIGTAAGFVASSLLARRRHRQDDVA